MQIDPAALTAPAAITVPSALNQKSTKALKSVPRLDLEPIYAELKAAIQRAPVPRQAEPGDQWAIYKEATTLFLLGVWLLRRRFSSFIL